MATNFYETYMKPVGRGRRGGGGMDMLSPVGRMLQQRGTPGGMLLGALLQGLGSMGRGGDNRTQDQIDNAVLHNDILGLNKTALEATVPFASQNAITDAQRREIDTQTAQEDLNRKKQLAPLDLKIRSNEAVNSDVARAAQQTAYETGIEQSIQKQMRTSPNAGVKQFLDSAIANGASPTAALKMAVERGYELPQQEGAGYIPISKQAETGGVTSWEDEAALANNAGLLKLFGVAPSAAEAKKEAAAAKTIAVAKAEQESVMKDAALAMKADLDNFHGIARSNGIKINLGAGDDELTDLGGMGSKLSGLPEEDRAQAMFYLKRRNDMLSSILNAKANGGLSRKTLAPFFTPEYVAGALNKSNTDDPTSQQDNSMMEGYDQSGNNLMGLPAAGTMQLRLPAGAGANLGQQLFPGGVPQGAGAAGGNPKVEALKMEAAAAIQKRPDLANKIMQRLQQLLGTQ